MKSTKRWELSIASTMLTTLLAAHRLLAQVGPAVRGVESARSSPAVTYDALHANFIPAQNLWMEGGAVKLGARLYRDLGIAARIEGQQSGFTAAPQDTFEHFALRVALLFFRMNGIALRNHQIQFGTEVSAHALERLQPRCTWSAASFWQ
jgi:hypothetical protein